MALHVIRCAVTDTGREIVFSDAQEKAGVNNLLEIYELLTGKNRSEIEAHFEGKGYAVLKEEVAEVVIEALRPIRERYRELVSDPAELDGILTAGAEHARSVAEPKIQDIKRSWLHRHGTNTGFVNGTDWLKCRLTGVFTSTFANEPRSDSRKNHRLETR